MSGNFNHNGVAENPEPTIEQPHTAPLEQAVAQHITHDDTGDGDEHRCTAATALNEHPATAPDIDADLPGAGKPQIIGNTSACASDTSSEAAQPAGEPVATEVTNSVGAVPAPQATVNPPRKRANVDAPARAPRAVSKAQRKRDLDAIPEDAHGILHFFDIE